MLDTTLLAPPDELRRGRRVASFSVMLAATLWTSGCSDQGDDPRDPESIGAPNRTPIIAIAGQSNADGRADIFGVTNWQTLDLQHPFSPVTYIEKRKDTPGAPPFTWDLERGPIALAPRPGGNQGIFGPELTLGRALIESDYEHALVKMAIGSTLLATHWRPVGGTFPTAEEPLFDRWIAQLHEAETALDGEVVGVVWVQGEADAGNLAAANAYAANLTTLISEFRARFPDTWWVINRLHAASGGSFNSTVRAHQDSVASTVAGVRIIGCDDLGLLGAHFTGDGYVELGRRFATAIDELVSQP